MTRRRRIWLGVLVAFTAIIGTAVTTRALGSFPGLSLIPRHRVMPGPAVLSTALHDEVRNHSVTTHAHDVEGTIAFALHETNARLRFGLSHRTSLRFDVGEREGNCVEYAQLFVAIFEMASRIVGIDARAVAIRSDARLFGRTVPMRGWRDHDWVLVEDSSGRRYFVDPSLADEGLGWNVAGSVRNAEALHVPR